MTEIVDIVRLGHAGDGVTADGLFVPYTLPGERVHVVREGARGRALEIVVPSPVRVAPACAHFGRCGGCALQMFGREPYLAWKRDLILTALQQRGLDDPPIEAIRAVPPGTRRRAAFKARAAGGKLSLGFYEPGGRKLIDIAQCPVLVPELASLIAPLKERLLPLLRDGETAELHTTSTDSGIDLSLELRRARTPDLLMMLGELSAALRVARLSWNGETVAMIEMPSLKIGRFTVVLPPQAFLQPSKEGERLLQELVREEASDARRIADLFAGCGTFALALAETRAIHAVEGASAQAEALAAAGRRARAKVTVETRDLFRRPLSPAELRGFDAVLLDPPRPGAAAQAEALAGSEVPLVLYVSCNPASFARDARLLVDGGYRLRRIVPIDQFVWSPHVELFAVFTRARSP